MTITTHNARIPAPSTHGTTLVWWEESDPDLFDDDLYDAMIRVERDGRARYDHRALGDLLGVAPATVRTWVRRGRFPRPDHYEYETADPDGVHANTVVAAIWTPMQVAEWLAT